VGGFLLLFSLFVPFVSLVIDKRTENKKKQKSKQKTIQLRF